MPSFLEGSTTLSLLNAHYMSHVFHLLSTMIYILAGESYFSRSDTIDYRESRGIKKCEFFQLICFLSWLLIGLSTIVSPPCFSFVPSLISVYPEVDNKSSSCHRFWIAHWMHTRCHILHSLLKLQPLRCLHWRTKIILTPRPMVTCQNG